MTFYTRHSHGVETKGNTSSRNSDDDAKGCKRLSIFSLRCRPLSKKKNNHPDHWLTAEAHNYVLFKCDEIQTYAN